MKRPDLRPYAPVGGEELYRLWFKITVYGNVLAFLYSISFWSRYADLHRMLFGPKGRLLPGAFMPRFSELMMGEGLQWSMLGYGILVIFLLALIPVNYSSFYRGSKSIYLMRRLPHRWELPKRCLTLPLLSAGGSLAIMGLVTLIYYVMYLLITPKACLL